MPRIGHRCGYKNSYASSCGSLHSLCRFALVACRSKPLPLLFLSSSSSLEEDEEEDEEELPLEEEELLLEEEDDPD